jgi:glycine/D-amino acid oxidase-like deaminating enzyme
VRFLDHNPAFELDRVRVDHYIDATPDAIPVVGEAGSPGLVVATGFTGHGFAMGPIVGRLVAELITDGRPSLDLRAFRFSRFAEGATGKPKSVL